MGLHNLQHVYYERFVAILQNEMMLREDLNTRRRTDPQNAAMIIREVHPEISGKEHSDEIPTRVLVDAHSGEHRFHREFSSGSQRQRPGG
jgi:hypothetical protein